MSHGLRSLLACIAVAALMRLHQTVTDYRYLQHASHAVGSPAAILDAVADSHTAAAAFPLLERHNVNMHAGTETTSLPRNFSPPLEPPAAVLPAPVRGCNRVRSSKFLLYAAHSGFGNQELSMRKALLVAYALNRTLLLPPLLKQGELAFGPPAERCADGAALADLQRRAENTYVNNAASSRYEPLMWAYNFSELQQLGIRVVDFASWARVGGSSEASSDPATWGRMSRPAWRHSPIANLSCAKGKSLTAAELRATLQPHSEAPLLRLGSLYFLKLSMLKLRDADTCFRAVVTAVLGLPLAPSVVRVARAAVRRIPAPYASVHLRISDAGVVEESALVKRSTSANDASGAEGEMHEDGHVAEDEIHRMVTWLHTRLRARLGAGPCQLYVATNLPGGARSPAIAPLCAALTTKDPMRLGRLAEGGCTCTDQQAMNLQEGPAWSLLLNKTGLSSQSAAMLIDQSVSAAAGRGFFSTSKFCGPAGFRRSTFSEAIALRWQHERADKPLCSNSMEHALLQGMAAHGNHVY